MLYDLGVESRVAKKEIEISCLN